MKSTFLIKTGLLALSVALCAPFALADTITFAGSDAAGDTFSGTLTATLSGAVYHVTDASGVVFRAASGLTTGVDPSASHYGGPWDINNTANSPGGVYNFDDIFYPGTGNADGDPFDHTGVLLILNGGKQVNLFCVALSQNCYLSTNDGYPDPQLITSWSMSIDTTPVPEPGTLVLFGTGALGLAGTIRRRFQA